MAEDKLTRILNIFYRAIRGEDLSVAKLSQEFSVSPKTISRDIAFLKDFFTINYDLVGSCELVFNNSTKTHRFYTDEFISDKELFAIAKVLMGARAFSKSDTTVLIKKLRQYTSTGDRDKLDKIISNELDHYSEIVHSCLTPNNLNVLDLVWTLTDAIYSHKEITIDYIKIDGQEDIKRIQPVSLLFSEYYYYLIAYYPNEYSEPRYFRVDRIKSITIHREVFSTAHVPDFNEGLLRKRSQFMFYGKLQTIKFWYSGPSVQAILDRLPTARPVEYDSDKVLLEAEVYGDGIKMFLLSQGPWVKVISPEELVKEMADTAREIAEMYS